MRKFNHKIIIGQDFSIDMGIMAHEYVDSIASQKCWYCTQTELNNLCEVHRTHVLPYFKYPGSSPQFIPL